MLKKSLKVIQELVTTICKIVDSGLFPKGTIYAYFDLCCSIEAQNTVHHSVY